MRNIKEINIKYRTYYFFNDMINIKDFDSSLLKIDKKLYKNIGIYNIGYIKIKKIDDYENIYSIDPLYLMIGEVIGHIEQSSAEEKNESKYLVLDSSDKNKEVLKNYKELWNWIKSEIQIINGSECNSIKCSSAETGMVKISKKSNLILMIYH